MADSFFTRLRALRLYDIIPIIVIVFVLYVWIFSSIVRMVIRNARTTTPDDFDLYLNETHFDFLFLKSLPEKTEYKTSADESLRKSNLKVNNGGAEMLEYLNLSRLHLVSLASADSPSISLPPYQHDNDTTFPPSLPLSTTAISPSPQLSTTAISPPLLLSTPAISPSPLLSTTAIPPPLPPLLTPAISPSPPPLSTTAVPPPPLPLLRQNQIQEQQLSNILEALIGAGDFAGWANLLSSADLSSLPLTATFFIPGNDAMSNLQTPGDPFLIAYHIIPQRLSFSDLQQFKPNTRIPTLMPSKFIVITNNSLSNFTIDGSQVTYPDLFVNSAFTVHGVNKILEYSVYGADPLFSPPPPPKKNTADVAAPSPPLKPKTLFPAGGRVFINGLSSDSASPLTIERLMTISVFLGVSIFFLL